MTRFKELQRIEEAIKNRSESELVWALNYCKMRLGIALRKDHKKHWHKLEGQVKNALAESDAK